MLCAAGQIAPQYIVPFAITASQIGSVAKQCKNIVVSVPEDNPCLKFFWVFKVVFFKSLLENPKKIRRFIEIFLLQMILKLFPQTCMHWYFFQNVLRYAVLVFNS